MTPNPASSNSNTSIKCCARFTTRKFPSICSTSASIYARRVEGKTVSIDMTLTAPACGMGDVLRAEVARRLQQVPNVEHVEVKLVFTPQWNRSMLSEVAKLELGMF